MESYKKWATAGVALTIMGVVAGCGIGSGASSGRTSAPHGTVSASNATNNTSTVVPSNNLVAYSNTTANNTNSTIISPSNSTNTSTHNNSPSGTNNTTVSNTGTSQTQTKVYVFSQPVLEVMYAAVKDSSVGPVMLPTDITKGVKMWAPKVSLAMLSYVPKQDRSLDKQLIDAIRNPQQSPLKDLPGYTFRRYQTPAGGGYFWAPTDNVWPEWVNPIQQ